MKSRSWDVDEKTFARALSEFANVVGADWVFSSAADLAMYRDAYTPMRDEPGELKAGAAVAPDSVEDVQAVVRIANRYRIPIYPVSTGRNLGYGGSAPVLSGSVVLDLKRMSRILEVNEDRAYALVEPGVSYMDLYRYIQERKYRLWVSSPAPGWGSLIGNALDRGVGGLMFPYYDHMASHCGMEIVLASGEIVRTGMGALPNSRTWQAYAHGCGASIDGLFGQSNCGIVTKMGFHLIREPEAQISFTAGFARYSELKGILELYNEWNASGFLQTGAALMSPVIVATLQPEFRERFPKFARSLDENEGPSDEEWEGLAGELGQPFWTVEITLYGPEEALHGASAYAGRRLGAIGGSTMAAPRLVRFPLNSEDRANNPMLALKLKPSLLAFAEGTRAAGYGTASHGHLWFSPLIAPDGDEIMRARRIFRGVINKWRISSESRVSIDIPSIQNRIAYMIYGFRVTDNREENRKARECYADLVRVGAQYGWGEYRSHPLFMDEVIAAYSYNDHALRRVQERIKDALDPNGILSAGRYGIWPRDMRNGE